MCPPRNAAFHFHIFPRSYGYLPPNILTAVHFKPSVHRTGERGSQGVRSSAGTPGGTQSWLPASRTPPLGSHPDWRLRHVPRSPSLGMRRSNMEAATCIVENCTCAYCTHPICFWRVWEGWEVVGVGGCGRGALNVK